MRGRLDLALPQEEDDLDDALPVELDALEQWSVGDRVLRDLLAGLPVDTVKQREWRRGVLPPGRLGWRLLDTLVRNAEPLAAAGLDARNTPARSVDVDVDLGGGRRLRGTVPGVYGERLVPVGYSRLAASHRLQSWVSVLALSASDPDRSWTALTIGRAGSKSRDSVATSLLGPLDHRAGAWLADLVALRDRGLREPLPLPLKTSLRYAGATSDPRRHRRRPAPGRLGLEERPIPWRGRRPRPRARLRGAQPDPRARRCSRAG